MDNTAQQTQALAIKNYQMSGNIFADNPSNLHSAIDTDFKQQLAQQVEDRRVEADQRKQAELERDRLEDEKVRREQVELQERYELETRKDRGGRVAGFANEDGTKSVRGVPKTPPRNVDFIPP